MDKRAFVEILRKHRDRVYSYSLYVLRDGDEAEDVTQDAFLRLWRRRDDVDPERVEAWLIRVAHNLCIDRARRRQTARRILATPAARDAVEGAVAVPPPPDGGVQRRQARQQLLDAMGTLQEEMRSALLLHYFQGLKIEEVARVLGKKTNTVKVQLHRARRALRRVLEPAGEGEPVVRRETG